MRLRDAALAERPDHEERGRRELRLEVTEQARDLLAQAGYDPEVGARPLKRLIQQTLVDPLARGILEGRFASGQTVVADVEPGTSWNPEHGGTPPIQLQVAKPRPAASPAAA